MKVFIGTSVMRSGMDFYLVTEKMGKRFLLLDSGLVEISEYEPTPKPTFHLNDVESFELLKSFAETAAEKGIKLESDLKREGKLEATERHLEDMRKLVFKVKS
jgi:hypothetical protein